MLFYFSEELFFTIANIIRTKFSYKTGCNLKLQL